MKLEDARTLALSLPGVSEEPHFEKVSFRIRGKIFATLPPDGKHIHIFVEEHEARSVVMQAASVCQELWWGNRLVGVRVNLSPADANLVVELLEEAWRFRAPKRLVAQFYANRNAAT